METEIDRLPVSELLARYNVGKSKLYVDLGQCKINPIKVQGRAYVTAEDLRRLDEYHAAEGKGREAVSQFLASLPNTEKLLVESDSSLSFTEELVNCLQALASHYSSVRLQQKMVLDIEEAAAVSGISKSGIRRAVKSGDLMAVKLGGRWRVRPSDLRKFVESLFDQRNFIG